MNTLSKILLVIFCLIFPCCGAFSSDFTEKIYPEGKIFPISIWCVSSKSEMEQVKKDGFNLIHSYNYGEGSEEDTKQWLDWAKEAGLFVIFNMGGFKKQAGALGSNLSLALNV
ncbi:MAG: hypothetical protein Q7J98_03735, partial [Kiritimatiellia bacterium]|nr:hypothetical protein [Kiritimatiellia bacterium]